MPAHLESDSSGPVSADSARVQPSIDTLLRLVPEKPTYVSSRTTYLDRKSVVGWLFWHETEKPTYVSMQLASNPHIASASDSTGYSLLHAASSYAQVNLLRELVRTYHVSPNVMDSDGETPLFAAESLDVIQILVEELGADALVKNVNGHSAEEQALENVDEGEGSEWMLIARYLQRVRCTGTGIYAGDTHETESPVMECAPYADGVRQPSRLPQGLRVHLGTMGDAAVMEGEPDPEFRRRIDELASRDDFQMPAGQAALRDLVRDAMSGVAASRDVRRRME